MFFENAVATYHEPASGRHAAWGGSVGPGKANLESPHGDGTRQFKRIEFTAKDDSGRAVSNPYRIGDNGIRIDYNIDDQLGYSPVEI